MYSIEEAAEMRKYLSLSFLFLIFTYSQSQEEDRRCDSGYECLNRSDCEFYQAELKRSKDFPKRSQERKDIIESLKELICNQKARKVCCWKAKEDDEGTVRVNGNPDSPDYLPGYGECGVSGDAEFIVGGEDTKLGEFPWAALIRKRRQDNLVRWHCGGTLVNKWYVVSAAHCDEDDRGLEEVRLGEWKVKNTDEFDRRYCKYFNEEQKQQCKGSRLCGEKKRRGNLPCTYENPNQDCAGDVCGPDLQDIKVAAVKKHPNYSKTDSGLAINDIMMIKLARPAVYNLLVSPVCLPPPDFDNKLGEEGHTPGFYRDRSVVVGWGRTYKGDYQETKQVAESKQQKLVTPLLSNAQCIQIFEEKVGATLAISVDMHLCAGGVRGEDSCNGDSGGPLLGSQRPIEPLTLIGVVSGGAHRCGRGTPAVYTRVSNYRDWILSEMV